MRPAVAFLAVVSLLVSGCAGSPASDDGSPAGDGTAFDDIDVAATATTGVLLGVVVDETIRPIGDATVTLTLPGGGLKNQTTDDEGRFAYDGLEPGTYFIAVTHLLHHGAQTSAEVVAGDSDPPIVRVQLTRLFDQEPFSEVLQFEGFIQCGYVLVILSSLCVNDYTTLVVPGGVYPQARETLDNRGYRTAVGPGWQSMVYDLVWEPTAQATGDEMFLLVSFFNRTASDAYANVGGTSPVLLRIDVGVVGEGSQGIGDDEGEIIPPEGHPDLYAFAGVEGDLVAAGFNQKFQVFQHNFYYGAPPEGWSFANGDAPPF